MNRYSITLGVAAAVLGAVSAGSATAATQSREQFTQASGACQGALPNYEGRLRKRPLAVANEGTGGAFVTCGVHTNDDTVGITAIEAYVTNRRATPTDVSCTLVDGFVDATIGFADYYPQTVNVGAGFDAAFVWDQPQFGAFTYAAISCNLPTQVEVNQTYMAFEDEIGT